MNSDLEKKFTVVVMVLSCAAAVFWIAPRAVMALTAPQEAVAEGNPAPVSTEKCESATWPDIPAECLTRTEADESIQVAGAQ